MTHAARDQCADGRAELPTLIQDGYAGGIRSLWLRLRLPRIAADGFDHVVGTVPAASGPEAVGHRLRHLAKIVDEVILEAVAVGGWVRDRPTPGIPIRIDDVGGAQLQCEFTPVG